MSDIVAFESNLDARVAFKRATGLTIRLTPWEAFTKINYQSGDVLVVTITTHTVEERRTEVILTGRGTKLIKFVQSETGWVQDGKAFVMWEPDFDRQYLPTYGPRKSPEEWLQHMIYSRMCHRVGTPTHPMDNDQRTRAGYTTDRMARHWA